MAKKTGSHAIDDGGASPRSEDEVQPLDFEEILGDVETIVRQLESGELSLAQSLQQYERAVGKMKQCYELLESVERKISLLSGFDADGNPVLEPMSDLPPTQRAR